MKRPILLIPMGSAGDVNPLIWIGKTLQAKGHRVRLMTSPYFQQAAEDAGLELVPMGTLEDYHAMVRHPVVWHPRKGTPFVLRMASKQTWETYENIKALTQSTEDRQTVLVAGVLAFGARLAREKLSLPLISAHLQPSLFRSLWETPVYTREIAWLTHAPIWLKKMVFWAMDRVVNRYARPAIREACLREGVRPPSNVYREWWDSPDGVFALFPDWFAGAQKDWPPRTHHLGFPLYDTGEVPVFEEELQRFLDSGPAPLLFTPGSAMAFGARFFQTALEACERLGLRALFVTRHPDQLPESLPKTIHAARGYVPFSHLMPKTALAVHHGGIGTLSQAMCAGIPQICMTMSHDQPDNAHRLEKLGVGRGIPAQKFNVTSLVDAIQSLLGNPEVKQNCRLYSERLQFELRSKMAESRLVDALDAILLGREMLEQR